MSSATISTLNDSNEYGKTAAKAYYLIVQCYIGLGDIEKAKTYIHALEDFISCKVSSVSTSPEREDTILIEDPFKI